MLPALFFLTQDCFGYLESMVPYNFYYWFFYFWKMPLAQWQKLHWICRFLWIIRAFKLLILPAHEYETPFHFSVFSSIYFMLCSFHYRDHLFPWLNLFLGIFKRLWMGQFSWFLYQQKFHYWCIKQLMTFVCWFSVTQLLNLFTNSNW